MSIKAISYVRFSSKEQAKGDSYRRQTEATQEYCTRKGITLIDGQHFDSGISAFKGKNQDEGALSEIIDMAKRGIYPKGTILIVESLDRISRQEINKALRLFLEILENGLDIVTLSDGERHYKHDKTELVDLIVSLVVLSRAHEESELKSQRVSAAWKGKRIEAIKSGKIITGVCPSWLMVENGKFKLIPERVKLVKEIFNLSIKENMGAYKIADYLNKKKIKPWGNEALNKSGLWSRGFVSALLNNQTVLGIHQPKKRIDNKNVKIGEPIKDYYPAIIDHETFNRNKAKSNNRKLNINGRDTKFKDWNLFRGLVKCSKCGNQLHFIGQESENKSKFYTYLSCSGKCGAKVASYSKFELLALSLLPSIDYNSINNHNNEIISRNEAREGQIIAKKSELKSLKENWKKTNSPTIIELILDAENEIAEITKQIEIVQDFKDTTNIDQRIDKLQERLESEDQSWRTGFRETVTKLVKGIILDTSTMKTELTFIHGGKSTFYYDKNGELQHQKFDSDIID